MKIIKKSEGGKSKSSFYGHLDKDTDFSVGAHDNLATNLQRKIVSISLDRIKGEEVRDIICYTYTTPHGTKTEIKELETVRDDITFESENEMLNSFQRIINMKDVESIDLTTFANDIKSYFSNDIRTAYKKFSFAKTKKEQHSVYIFHIFALLVATETLINDIDYKSPIKIVFEKHGDCLLLKLKLNSKQRLAAKDRRTLRHIPNIEAKLAYIAALCRTDGINSTLRFNKYSIIAEYEIYDQFAEKGKLYSKSYDKEQIFSELMELFSCKEKEEPEEEELP